MAKLEAWIPSWNRPDSKVFYLAQEQGIKLNIVTHTEGQENYEKWKDIHNVFVTERGNHGVIVNRNYINQNAEEWALVVDDDFWEYKERQKGKVLFSRYMEIIEENINKSNTENVAIIGFIREPFFFDKNDMPSIKLTKSHHQGQVVLNTPLIRKHGFQYRGVKRHGSILEDIDMCYQIMHAGLENMVINQTTAIENKKITSTICDYQHDPAAKLIYWAALGDLVERWRGTSMEKQVLRLYEYRRKDFIKMGIIKDEAPAPAKLFG
jgi:hypothetical protein